MEEPEHWSHEREDVAPIVPFATLWADMNALPDARCSFVVVPRNRGQQLKDPAQLDGWLRDGSADSVERLCEF